MAPKPCAQFKYVQTPSGGKIIPVPDVEYKDEESPADYNIGGYLPVKVNDTFKHHRYKVLRKLGWGHFSTVWLVKDTEFGRHSALKVVKSAGRYAETARDEIKLLTQVAGANPKHLGRDHIVSFLDSFCHTGPEASHVCIVFEPLGENLLALIERNKKSGVPRPIVKIIAKQILLGLQYLHDECDLVHTDIKPENILIAIPDVEDHIHTELSISPTASSVHVGIPPSAKASRAGLAIPHHHHHARRQVQIFESQPLSSPGRRSGSNSASGSFTAPMQMSRLSAANSVKSTVQQVNKALTSKSFDPKVAQRPHTQHQTGFPAASNSPSTSSSSSSISATSVADISNSPVSTPPTSVSHSVNTGAIASGLTVIAGRLADKDVQQRSKPIPTITSGAMGSEQAAEGSVSTSWRDKLGLPSSWTERLSSAFKTSPESSSHPTPQGLATPSTGHARTTSKSAPWKAPEASLAPAVVVPASVSMAGDGDSVVHVSEPGTRSSSATLHSKPSGQSTPLASSSDNNSSSKPLTLPKYEAVPVASTSSSHATNSQPSLLTQTAPGHVVPMPSERHASPKHNFSHLSAHMHHAPTESPTTIPHTKKHNGSHRKRQSKALTPPTSITPTPALSICSPSTPPPTPRSEPSSPVLAKAGDNPQSPTIPLETPPPPVLDPQASQPLFPITIKIADLGNATPSKKHYTEDIQTRQYRAPEAILGRRDWGTRVDIWSVACLVFELLTADYLFDPQGQGELFTKDDDHMAQIIELMGDLPMDIKMGGKYSRELFDHTGHLRYIRTLKPWPLKCVLIEKYSLSDADATLLCDFLEPLLAPDMRVRKDARDMVNHPWLDISPDEDFSQEW